MKFRIRNAQVVLPDGVEQIDVVIDGNYIAELDAAAGVRVDEELDAAGLHLLPGVIDDQVHFREPGLTHKEDLASGARACAKGGITTFLEMPNTIPATTNQTEIDKKLVLASSKSIVNYGFYVGATPDNLDDLQAAERTPGIKIFIGSSTGDLLVDDQQALERIFGETTLPITAHCEDESTIRENRRRIGESSDVATHSLVRDHRAAIVATRRAIDLAKRHHHRFHVLHVSTGDEVDLLMDHGGLITAEACPHHLFFSVDDYPRLGTRLQANPSVKTLNDSQRLWQALLNNHIQVIATDHAPHTLKEKSQPYPQAPSGIPAVENNLTLMLNQVALGRCSISQVAQWMSDAPARVWDIVNKGRIAKGYDADLVLVDLHAQHTIRDEEQLTKCGWSPWDGETLTGRVMRTWVMGHTVFAGDEVVASQMGQEATFDHLRGGYWATT